MERIRKLLGREEEKEEKAAEEVPAAETTEETVQEEAVHEEAAHPETPAEPVSEEPAVEPEPDPETKAEETVPEEPVPDDRRTTLPYHSEFTERLKYLFGDPTAAAGMEGPDEFALEFMAMGERFYVVKEAHGEMKYGAGSAPDEDVYIRIANDTVAELLSAATFAGFSEIYIRDYRKPDAGKFVKIELRKDISSMNRRGYARIPLLKLLVGQAR
jgi:hypothetical protein